MNLMVLETEKQTYELEDTRGIGDHSNLIIARNADYDNLNDLYFHLEQLRLRECEICNIIIDKKVLLNGKFHERDDALMNLDCTYWVKLLENSRIRDLMPYTEYSDLLDKFKTRDRNNYIEFSEQNVKAFISKLSNDRPLLFANKVNCVIQELDWNYKNNQGSMLPPLMVLSTSYSIFPSWQNCMKVDDLRYSICQIYGLSLEFEKTQNILSWNDCGEWISLENDLIRIKRFKNANIHILLSDVVYDKLNEVIALVNANLLSQTCKKLRKKTYKYTGE